MKIQATPMQNNRIASRGVGVQVEMSAKPGARELAEIMDRHACNQVLWFRRGQHGNSYKHLAERTNDGEITVYEDGQAIWSTGLTGDDGQDDCLANSNGYTA